MYLVDINNLHNLKKILKLFNYNFNKENYDLLNNLKRITTRKKKIILKFMLPYLEYVFKNKDNLDKLKLGEY